MINEIFLPAAMGSNLKGGLITLMNEIKVELLIPYNLQLADISSIFKMKGSKFELSDDRGFFILSVVRKILDKLLYQDKYSFIDSEMSDSNIGARRNKNVKNHLFIVYGIINSVIREEKFSLDIQIYDLVQAFDSLWLEDCMNDIYDSVPKEQQDDKLALIFETNKTNLVAVNTPVGQTDRVNIERIVTQGGTFGPLECSNSIDKIGKNCIDNGKHLYTYKNLVKVMPLAMVDDLLAMSTCGQESVSMNTFMNTQIELKKLRFHTPDKNGKTKCHKIHVGPKNNLCPHLEVHGTKMVEVDHDTYRGDIVSSDGKNTKNVRNRISKGIGIISDIMNILEKVTFGEYYFSTALLLRESKFLNGILTNAEVWYGLSKTEIDELEELDCMLLRKILKTKCSVPLESLYLELGCLNIGTILKARRINYLHYLMSTKETEMLHKFFQAQWKYPTKNDWTEQTKADLEDFGITVDLVKSKSKYSFSQLVKRKSKEFAFQKCWIN